MKNTHKINNIITRDMALDKDIESKNPKRERLKKAGKIILSGLIAGGAIAGLVTTLGSLPSMLTIPAILGTAGLSACQLAEAGSKVGELINSIKDTNVEMADA